MTNSQASLLQTNTALKKELHYLDGVMEFLAKTKEEMTVGKLRKKIQE
jgi:hypothetical protein